ncbi:MAG: hypothetical protein IJ150_00625 [Bacteroidales bacterium]|nr:hypothetical protein [Bacteroidales bacterium]
MSKYRLIIFLSLFFFVSSGGFAQQKIYRVSGRIYDENLQGIKFAHVVNVKRKTACITDTAGRFKMLVTLSDTIKISCIGFQTTGFSLSSLSISQEEERSQEIELPPIILIGKTYELETVSVYAERWRSFVYDWQQIDPEEEPQYVSKIETWKNNLINLYELKQLTTAASGVGINMGFLYDRKRRKAVEKVNEDKRQTVLDNEALAKYNPTVVSEITGLSLEDAEKFIMHFQLDRDFILKRNDYDLYLIITQLFKEYKK